MNCLDLKPSNLQIQALNFFLNKILFNHQMKIGKKMTLKVMIMLLKYWMWKQSVPFIILLQNDLHSGELGRKIMKKGPVVHFVEWENDFILYWRYTLEDKHCCPQAENPLPSSDHCQWTMARQHKLSPTLFMSVCVVIVMYSVYKVVCVFICLCLECVYVCVCVGFS